METADNIMDISTQRTYVPPFHMKQEALSLPRKFLFDLYQEGYTVVDIPTQTDPVLKYVSMQLVRCGVVFSEDELKEKLVKSNVK